MAQYQFSPEYEYWWGPHHDSNYALIKKYFSDKTPLNFLEIGVFEARTSVWMLDNVLKDDQDKIYCIEASPSEKGLYNLSLHGEKVVFIRGRSEDVLCEFMGKYKGFFDFIYVDGDHLAPNAILDIVLCWRLLKKDGIMLMDDYYLSGDDKSFDYFRKSTPYIIPVKEAIRSFLFLYQGQYKALMRNSQVGLQKTV